MTNMYIEINLFCAKSSLNWLCYA